MPFTRAPRYSGESLPSAARTTRERRSRRRGGSVVPPPANRRRADYFLLAAFFFAGFLAAVFFFAGAFFAVLRAALAMVFLRFLNCAESAQETFYSDLHINKALIRFRESRSI